VVLVTGALGKVGKHVVAAFRRGGHFVVGLDLARGVFDTPGPDDCDVYLQSNLMNEGEVFSAIARFRPRAVVHVAAIPDPTHTSPSAVFSNNVTTTFNVVEATMRLGVPRLVNISSETVPGFFGPNFCAPGVEHPPIRMLPAYAPVDEAHPCAPQDPYALSKHFGEQLCAAAVARAGGALTAVSIRPSWCQDAGNVERNLGPFVRDPSLWQPGMWAYIPIPDLADAIVKAATVALPPGTGHEVVYIAAADTIGGRDLKAAVAAAYDGRVPVREPLSRPDASGLDCAKAKRLLGWEATLSWRDYLDGDGRLRPDVAAKAKAHGPTMTAAQLRAA